MYNVEEIETNNLYLHFEMEYLLTQQIPPHPNVSKPLHRFTDVASYASLPEWDVDPKLVHSRTFFIVYEYMETSLKQLITEKTKRSRVPPFFDLFEFLGLAQQLLSALHHVHSQVFVASHVGHQAYIV